MEDWLQHIIRILPDGGAYLSILFLVAFVESLPMIGLLMPGSTLVVFAGFLVFHGKCTFPLLTTIVIFAALLGDLMSYWLGQHYGSKLIKLRSFQKHHQLVSRSQQFFVDHGGKSIFFARFLGPIRGITPFIAGLSGMKGRTFCYYAVISAALWGVSYPGVGYLGGQSWQHAQGLSVRFGLLIIVLLLLVVLHHRIRKKLKG